MSLLSKIFISLINVYQRFISPLLGKNKCRHVPTCSGFTKQAIQTFGPIKGSIIGIKRILSCNPFSVGGVNPVQQYFFISNPTKKKGQLKK